MDETQQKRIMLSIFGAMMFGGHFRNESRMLRELKAIHYLLRVQEHLSDQESDNCLFYFYKEYSKGCRQPISDSYIRKILITIVKNFESMDLIAGASLLLAAKMNV